MLILERHQKILSLIRKEKTVTIKKITSTLFVSPATARRDLAHMEKQGLLKRIRGGAAFLETPSSESSILIREQINVKEKRKIALKCAEYLRDGHSYFIDPSTTVSHVLPFFTSIADSSIITNGINNALLASNITNSNVYLSSGEVTPTTNSCLGSTAIRYIESFNCNTFIFSCSGISADGRITEASLEQSCMKKVMLAHSSLHILLADHTKFNKFFLSITCTLKDVDILITDQVPPENFVQIITDSGVELVIAN